MGGRGRLGQWEGRAQPLVQSQKEPRVAGGALSQCAALPAGHPAASLRPVSAKSRLPVGLFSIQWANQFPLREECVCKPLRLRLQAVGMGSLHDSVG